MAIGQRLLEARQRRGLTLDDISRTTKIPVALLQAIERNDAARLPQEFFTRAFVRAYANEVGLSPEQIVDGVDNAPIEKVPAALPMGYAPVPELASSKSFIFVAALCAACAMFYSGYASQTSAPVTPQVASPRTEPPTTDRVDAAALTVPPCEAPAPVPTAIKTARRVNSAPVETLSAAAPTPVPVTHAVPDAPIETSPSPTDAPPVVTDALLPQPEATTPAPAEQF